MDDREGDDRRDPQEHPEEHIQERSSDRFPASHLHATDDADEDREEDGWPWQQVGQEEGNHERDGRSPNISPSHLGDHKIIFTHLRRRENGTSVLSSQALDLRLTRPQYGN
jgi:hypothetical protein